MNYVVQNWLTQQFLNHCTDGSQAAVVTEVSLPINSIQLYTCHPHVKSEHFDTEYFSLHSSFDHLGVGLSGSDRWRFERKNGSIPALA